MEKYPMRINKYLALNKYCSRREADKFIEQKQVKINGRIAVLGDQVNKGDKVEVGGAVKKHSEKMVYYAYNKPVGIETNASSLNQKAIKDVSGLNNVFPIGRLDKNSHGLIILTNDGRITESLLSPKYNHEKEYEVKVNKNLREGFLRKLAEGIVLEDGKKTKPAKVKKLGDKTFRLTLTEGKKHQIRRMCAAFGYDIKDLQRVRVMNILLGDLKSGASRKIEGEELMEFLKILDR